MLRKLYNKVMSLSDRKSAMWFLAAISFIESSFFPIPPDALLIPMVLSNRSKAVKIAFVCTLSSVLGALFGYVIGAFLYDSVAEPLLELYHYTDKFNSFKELYNSWGSWVVAFFGFTPFPYKVITITSGVVNLNLLVFIIASILSRGARFFLIAGLLWKWDGKIKDFIERRLGLLTFLFFALILVCFFALKYII
ncbi:MAG: DedA family protein [Alphaproteobacteria bacterium]|jgi:membrane protein YqaA with SNARE-associated domain|nr:DedA family protein [Alphaproteobacteria bacterium]MCV6599728.1 DedA family protein [Alphaproteobacteria bacterium]